MNAVATQQNLRLPECFVKKVFFRSFPSNYYDVKQTIPKLNFYELEPTRGLLFFVKIKVLALLKDFFPLDLKNTISFF